MLLRLTAGMRFATLTQIASQLRITRQPLYAITRAHLDKYTEEY